MKGKLLPLGLLVVALAPVVEAQDNGFQCEEHSLFLYRLGQITGSPPLPDGQGTKILVTKSFSGFAKYGIDSVELTVRLEPDTGTDSEGRPKRTGDLRVAATIHSHDTTTTEEIRTRDFSRRPKLNDVYTHLSMLLRARLTPAEPMDPDSGRPNIRIEQPETSVPIILVKFIGIAAAGGWGDVDSDNAMVLDLRQGVLSVPAALGCIKDDFAGQGSGGGWATCSWDRARQDYDCKSSRGEFLLISGKRT